jgi:WD40 repeat protein
MKNISIFLVALYLTVGILLSCSNKEVVKKQVPPHVKSAGDKQDTPSPAQTVHLTNKDDETPSHADTIADTNSSPKPANSYSIKELKNLDEPNGSIESIEFSKDGTLLATSGRHNDINIWEVEKARLLKTLKGHTNTVECVDFSIDGKHLASGSWDGTLRIWNLATGWVVHVMQGHSDKVRSVSFSPDGLTIASGSDDKTVRLWDVKTGRLIRVMRGHSRRTKSVKFSPNGDLIASGSDDQQIKIWDAKNGRHLKTLVGHTSVISSLAFSPDGGTIVSGSWDDNIILWNVESGKIRRTLKGHSISVRTVSFSPDGELIASGSDDKTIKFWNANNGTLLTTQQAENGNIFTIAFSPDGTKLASGGSGGSVKIWDIPYDLYAGIVKDSVVDNDQSDKTLVSNTNIIPPPNTPQSNSNNTSIQGIPELTLDLVISDEGQNGIFDGKESMYIVVTAKNTGTAASKSSRLIVEGIEAFHIPSKIFVGDIAPGKTIEKRLAYELPEKISGTYQSKFVLEDNNGFRSSPKIFNLKASEFKPPILLVDYAVKDAGRDGKLNAGEEAILYLYLRNTGGKAQNIKVIIGFPNGVYIIGKKSGSFSIDSLNNGEFKELATSIVVSQDYAQKADNVPVTIKISSRETEDESVIKLALNEYLPSPEEMEVKPVYSAKKNAEPPVASSDIDRKIRDLPDPATTDKNVIALVIGIDRYKNIPRSMYSTYDAGLMYNLIKKSIKAQDIILLSDQDASYLTIKDKINYIAQNAKDKTVYLFYSGHGFSTADKRPSIVPYDTPQSMPDESLITLDGIINNLTIGQPKKVIILTDSCFSGTDREGRSLIASARPIFNVPQRIKLPSNFILLTATDNKGKSYSDNTLKHGIFTYYAALALTGSANTDEDSELKGREIYNYVREMVVNKTKKLGFYDQIPSINQDGEDIVIFNDLHK